MLELTLRLVFSLAVVIGLLLLLSRIAGRRLRGGSSSLVTILHRQAITRGSAVVVVSVGSRVLVLGTTEQQVRVLTELDPDEVESPAAVVTSTGTVPAEIASTDTTATAAAATAGPASAPTRGAHRAEAPALSSVRPTDGALAGSVLSVDTWRQALAAATRRAS